MLSHSRLRTIVSIQYQQFNVLGFWLPEEIDPNKLKCCNKIYWTNLNNL